MNDLETSRKKLWNQLLADRQFYAFEFLNDQFIEDIRVDFLCTEVSFIVRIETKKIMAGWSQLTPAEKKQLKDKGFTILIISAQEVLENYTQVVQLIDREFTSLTKFECG